MMQLPISTDQAEALIREDVKYIISTLENALDCIKNPNKEQLNMEGYRAKIYINESLLKTLDKLEKLQLDFRAENMKHVIADEDDSNG
jgi:hypothetical protein